LVIIPITKGSPNASSMRLILPVSSDHIVPTVHVLIHFLHGSGLFARGGDMHALQGLSNWLG